MNKLPIQFDATELAQQGESGVAVLERLLAMQERLDAAAALQAYNDAQVRVQAAMQPVFASSLNTQTRSKFARLDAVDDAIRKIYTSEGFRLSFTALPIPDLGPEWFLHTVEVSHSGGHVAQYSAPFPIDMLGPKGNAVKTALHGVGSMLTYAQRRLTCMAFNVVVTAEDRDGNPPPDDTPVSGEDAEWLFREVAELYPRPEQIAALLAKFTVDGKPVESVIQIPARFMPQLRGMLAQRREKMGAAR